MSTTSEKCNLCHRNEKIRKSHIISKFVYKNITKNQPYEKNCDKAPMIIDTKFPVQKSILQYKKELFCDGCEQLFSAKETIMARIISDVQGMDVTQKSGLFYGGELIYNKYNGIINMYFTPSIVVNIKYFALSCIYRQLICEKININHEFISKCRNYLLDNNGAFNTNIIVKVNNGSNFPLATSLVKLQYENFTHLLFVVPEFFFHLILDDRNPTQSQDILLITPEDLSTDKVLTSILNNSTKGKSVSKNTMEFLKKFHKK